MDQNRISLLFDTVKYLKPIQIYYRFLHIYRKYSSNNYNNFELPSEVIPINWSNFKFNQNTFLGDLKFKFLNLEKHFKDVIDWNFEDYGKLWIYNLNYFDFLNQSNLNKVEGLKLINDYISKDRILKDGKEPYPISLRSINYIKFLSVNKLFNEHTINKYLYGSYKILLNNLEYHLLGNHLLENGFSLFFGAIYFKDKQFEKVSEKIITAQLEEQILDDGAHFELSPMYHKIILDRLLDCINLMISNNYQNPRLFELMISKAQKMLSWLELVTFSNGETPMLNDSSYGIAPSTRELVDYASFLNLHWNSLPQFSNSGYRFFFRDSYELLVDVGNIGPDYQPGHAHADTFNFILHSNNSPVFVDTGTSTYESNKLRQIERSTSAHNTVTINKKSSSEVWGGFRVGKRAKILSLYETKNSIKASHDGFQNDGLIHKREWILGNNKLSIIDSFTKTKKKSQKQAHFHLHPTIKSIELVNSEIYLNDLNIRVRFQGDIEGVEMVKYNFSHGFNHTEQATKLIVTFNNSLKTIIEL